MPVEAPLLSGHPALMVWETYKTTPEYANTKKWAADDKHVDGSLWAAFLQGYYVGNAAGKDARAILEDVGTVLGMHHVENEINGMVELANHVVAEVQGYRGALEFLKRAGNDGRIVSSNDLHEMAIAEAAACGRFYVEPGGGLGWALLPWDLNTAKDRERMEKEVAAEGPDQPDQCCECDQPSVGNSEGSPYCAEHYRRRKWGTP